VLEIAEALRRAEEAELDLVEVSPEANPPVCKILDYGKFQYQQKKKTQQKHKPKLQLKEIRLRPKIGEHDLEVKLKQIREFIVRGDKVLVMMNFKGREIVHIDNAKGVMEQISTAVADIAKLEKPTKFEGRRMSMLLTAK
jgi:translation initiation factor IF-3